MYTGTDGKRIKRAAMRMMKGSFITPCPGKESEPAGPRKIMSGVLLITECKGNDPKSRGNIEVTTHSLLYFITQMAGRKGLQDRINQSLKLGENNSYPDK